jgi:hypothetical protein
MTTELKMMLDHVSLSVADMDRAKRFYAAILAELGMELVGEVTAEQSGSVAYAGFGIGRKGQLWLSGDGPQTPIRPYLLSRGLAQSGPWPFMLPGLPMAGATTARPAFARSIIRSTTRPLSPIPKATTSRPSASSRRTSNDLLPHIHTGGCQCGAVRYRIEGELEYPHLCHCRMCQKAAGNYFMPLGFAPGEDA